jgi:indole-3-glycerol phosphate synthase
MAPTYLDEIVARHRARAERDTRDWRARVELVELEHPSFLNALRKGASPYIKVIAEIKRRSPSKGWLNEHLDVGAQARLYRDGDAAAISVLTDEEYFSGSLEDLRVARATVSLPLLRKDFTVSENDVLDARDAGASAVLLIVAALSDEELASFLRVSDEVGLDAVVEVHEILELKRAIDAGAKIIGVNQRDLRTFEVDPERAEQLRTEIPRECVSVCESGLRNVSDVERAAKAGFDAILVGESLITSSDPLMTLKSFSLVSGQDRG